MKINFDNLIQTFILGQMKQLVNALPFRFCQNKIALVEKENTADFEAMQYLIENDWNLMVSKVQDTLALKRKMPDGQLMDLHGKKIVYHDKFAKNPKIQ